jgi:hydrogenase maturation protease
MPDLREQLEQCFQGRVCLMGLGNVDYGDDGFGVRLAERIGARAHGTGDAPCRHDVINAGTMPERFLGRLAKEDFDNLIFLDAIEFNGAPGSMIFLNAGEMTARFPQISTHKISLGVLAEYIEAEGTKAWLLGVQPKSLKTAGGLTPIVQATLEVLDEMLCDLLIARKEAV